MARKTLKATLMERDELTAEEAAESINECREDLMGRIERDDPSAHDILEEYFGLEPDWLDELL